MYRELRELAKSLKQKPLIIPNHFDTQTGTYLDLVTSWFDTAYVDRNGAGYFAVTISQVLKPYLLQVKREFFRFRLLHVMQLRSSYAIRLYQWAKRWEFRKNMEISVQELRNVLGANNGPDEGTREIRVILYAKGDPFCASAPADELSIEDILAVEHDVIPLDGADVFQQGEIDSIGDWVALTQDPGDFARLPIDDARQDQVQAAAGVHLLPQLAGVDPAASPVKDVSGQGVELLDLEQAAPDASAQFRLERYWRMNSVLKMRPRSRLAR